MLHPPSNRIGKNTFTPRDSTIKQLPKPIKLIKDTIIRALL